MTQLALVMTVAVLFGGLFLWLYGLYKEQQKKADKIEELKHFGEIRERITKKLYDVWQSREDTGMHYVVLRDSIFRDTNLPLSKYYKWTDEYEKAYQMMQSQKLIEEDKTNDVSLTDAGISYYEKVLGGPSD